MPIMEAIVSTTLPKEVEKPIPVRTISTRPQPKARPNINQGITPEIPAAESAIPADSVKLSPQLTALARKEQAYRQREQALKAREQELESRLAKAEQYSQLETGLKSQDFAEAERLGLTYEGYTKYLLDKQAGEDPNTQAFKALEAKIQALEKSKEESATKEYEETVAEYRTEIAKLVADSPEFSKLKKAKKEDAVLQLILDSWEEDGEEVTIESAARDVEAYLAEQAKQWAALIEEPKPEQEEPQRAPPPRPGTRTLTQQMQPSGHEKRPAKSYQHMSESERYAEARRRVMERRQP